MTIFYLNTKTILSHEITNLKLLFTIASLTLEKKLFSETIADGWNSLPENIVDYSSLKTFKILYQM